MRIDRRTFLKRACASAGALALLGMTGCAPSNEQREGAINDEQEGAEMGNEGNEAAMTSESASTESAGSAASSTAVIFFSCTGNTEAVAERIATATNGSLMRIDAAEPYSDADLDYNADCRANAEQNSGSVRPALADPVPDLDAYETVYLGYPIWWGTAPRIVLTFLEGADTAGKTIVPFCTSGSSPISGSIAELHDAASEAHWLEGRRLSRSVSQQEIDAWVAENR